MVKASHASVYCRLSKGKQCGGQSHGGPLATVGGLSPKIELLPAPRFESKSQRIQHCYSHSLQVNNPLHPPWNPSQFLSPPPRSLSRDGNHRSGRLHAHKTQAAAVLAAGTAAAALRGGGGRRPAAHARRLCALCRAAARRARPLRLRRRAAHLRLRRRVDALDDAEPHLPGVLPPGAVHARDAARERELPAPFSLVRVRPV